MAVRRETVKIRVLMIAAAAVLLAGCTSTPEPYFGWGTQGASTHRTAVAQPRPRPAARYASDDTACDNCSTAPAPRPRPRWYDQSVQDRPADYRQTADNRDIGAGPAQFQWPVRGRVVGDFGSYANGQRSDGINIAAGYGEPIHASADGVVRYSGNELRGYGNLALIEHSDGYFTAYAHADRFVVARGDHVARGQVIGYVGTSGGVGTPQLHFEVRHGNHGQTPINPRPLLGHLQVAAR
jgi:murein DD-endopeptidase MepM/ murein hydrolase activator NlpD